MSNIFLPSRYFIYEKFYYYSDISLFYKTVKSQKLKRKNELT